MGEIEMSEIKVPQENIIYAWDNVEEIKACLEFIDIEKVYCLFHIKNR